MTTEAARIITSKHAVKIDQSVSDDTVRVSVGALNSR